MSLIHDIYSIITLNNKQYKVNVQVYFLVVVVFDHLYSMRPATCAMIPLFLLFAFSSFTSSCDSFEVPTQNQQIPIFECVPSSYWKAFHPRTICIDVAGT